MPKSTLVVSRQSQDLLMRVGAQLREARERRGLTMEALADQLHTSVARIRRAEAGDASVAVGLYAQLLTTYGLGQDLAGLASAKTDPVAQAIAQTMAAGGGKRVAHG